MRSVLVAWIGHTDLRASDGDKLAGDGPIGQAVQAQDYDQVWLLSNYDKQAASAYRDWLGRRSSAEIRVESVALSRPTDFGGIYEAAIATLDRIRSREGERAAFTFHLSPGTPAMAAVWILLSKTRYPAQLIESSKDHGVSDVSIPFDISAEFLPQMFREPDRRLADLASGLTPAAPAFDDIVHQGPQMQRVVAMARRVAPRSVPVLLEGESGTGKELIARAIHRASPREAAPFIAVNCGAIPKELFESEFFGHEKGAFTGAAAQRLGHFEQANGGTLFLDEVGELPASDQVKLLRVLQQQEVVRVGSSKGRSIDVRIIAATNRDLRRAIQENAFREDLYYRLAVAVIGLPPLRAREGDLNLLIDRLLDQVNNESRQDPGFQEKKLSPGARNVMLRHWWPGNVRELLNALRRATIWSGDATITEQDMRDALRTGNAGTADGALSRLPDLAEGVDVVELTERIKRHYLEEALRVSRGNKTEAAKLLGLNNYQTVTNWMKSFGLE